MVRTNQIWGVIALGWFSAYIYYIFGRGRRFFLIQIMSEGDIAKIMALVDGDIVKYTLRSHNGTVLMANVFHYEVTNAGSIGTNYTGLAQSWWDDLKAAIRGWMPSTFGATFDDVLVDNLTNGLDFGSYSIPSGEQAGLRSAAGEALPLFNAAKIRLNVGTRLTRPGQKRFFGVMEIDQNQGILQSAALTALTTLATALAATQNFGLLDAGSQRPVVYGLPHAERPDPVSQPVISATALSAVTSQVSRKS